MVSVDPKAVDKLKDVKRAVTSLKDEVKLLADEAARYAENIGRRPGHSGTGSGRVGGMQAPMAVRGGGGARGGAGGEQRQEGGLSRGEEVGLGAAILAPQIFGMLKGQFQNMMLRDRVSTRMAGAAPGQFAGRGQVQEYATMMRGVGGYYGSGDLYGGVQQLQQTGLLWGGKEQVQGRLKDVGLMARMSGMPFSEAAGVVTNMASPQSVNAMRMFGINPTPGGQLTNLPNLFEQLYQQVAGGETGAMAERRFQTMMRPGSGYGNLLQSMGFDSNMMEMLREFGTIRSERAQRGEGAMSEDEFRKEIKAREDLTEEYRKQQEAMTKFKETLFDGVIPVLTLFADVVRQAIQPLQWFADHVPGFTLAVKGATAALIAYTAAHGAKAILGRMAGPGGAGWAGKGAGLFGKVAGRGALLAGGVVASQMAGGALEDVIGGEEGSTRARLGRAAGGALQWGGTGATIGAVVGGPVGAAIGGGIGAVAGGIGGFFGIGDDLSGDKGDAIAGYSDKELLSNPPPAVSTPGGGPLPGRGNSSSLDPEFVRRLQAMFDANPKLTLTSGFRSHEEQAYLRWQKLTGRKRVPVAKVGQSRHESGRAADVGPRSEYNWLLQHAKEFGLKHTVLPSEPWHLELSGGGTNWSPPQPGGRETTGAAQAAGKTPTSGTPVSKQKIATTQSRSMASSATDEAAIIERFFRGGPGSTIGGGDTSGDVGDGVTDSGFIYGGGGGRGTPMTSVTIQNATFKVEIARGTPEEAERTARYLMSIMSDRDRLIRIAQGV